VPLDAGGSFRTEWSYRVLANAATLGAGSYTGQFVTTGSAVAEENKTVPVNFTVTAQPVVQVQPSKVSLQMMQNSYTDANSQGAVNYITVTNAGSGALSVTGVTVNITGGGDWLKAQSIANGAYIQLNTKPGSLAVGKYVAEVDIATNAVNGATVKVPVEMEVVANGPPFAFFGGAINNSTAYNAGDLALAPGTIVSLYGQYFLLKDPVPNSVLPLPRSLGDTQVLVNGIAAPLYYASDGQINFQMPYETGGGQATIQVVRAGVAGNKISAQIHAIVPRVLLSGTTPIIINPDGSWATATPIPGVNTRPAHPGETVVIYMIGDGQTSPAAVTGAAVPSPPGSPLQNVPGPVEVKFGGSGPIGGTIVTPIFAGLTPGFVGLYQVNVTVPFGVPSAPDVVLNISIAAQQANTVTIAIQ
jgi:uncharacterized protein (TIGR03437 family)